MTDLLLAAAPVAALPRPLVHLDGRAATSRGDLHTLLARRRSVRRLRPGPFDEGIVARLTEAIRLTPSAFNIPPWHVVIVHERRDDFWALVERECRLRLRGDRRARYLDRIAGFRTGVGAILVYQRRASASALQSAWQISEADARAFVEQGLGMVQLSIWLSLTADALAASLQHWDWFDERQLAAFLDLPAEDHNLVSVMPIGYPADTPLPAPDRPELPAAVSREWFSTTSHPAG